MPLPAFCPLQRRTVMWVCVFRSLCNLSICFSVFSLTNSVFIQCQANLVQGEGSQRQWNSNKSHENYMFLCKKKRTRNYSQKDFQLKAALQLESWRGEAAKDQQKDGYWEVKSRETLPQEISAYCTLHQYAGHREPDISSSTHKARICASESSIRVEIPVA